MQSTTKPHSIMLKERLRILLTTQNPPEHYSTHLQSLQACIVKNTVSQGEKLQPFIALRRFAITTCIAFHNKLIYMYAKCENLVDARKVFNPMKEWDSISWNTIIAAYRRHEYSHEVVTMFHNMQQTGFQPDQFTFASILPACTKIGILEWSMDIHQSIKDRGILSDVLVATTLMNMYAKYGSMDKVCALFDRMLERSMISSYAMAAGHA